MSYTFTHYLIYRNPSFSTAGNQHLNGHVANLDPNVTSPIANTIELDDSPGVDGTTNGIWTFGEQLDEIIGNRFGNSNDGEFITVLSTPFGDGAAIHDTFGAGNEILWVLFDSFAAANWAITNMPSFTVDSSQTWTECFGAGTMIAAASGETKVEDLKIGDEILKADGGTTTVKWVGYQDIRLIGSYGLKQPICIRAGALGKGLPTQDLVVTADHAIALDGYLINASALVNNDTIDYMPSSSALVLRVYHVETEAHDVILANGCPAESYFPLQDRSAFANHQEYLDLYGTDRLVREMTLPRLTTARLLPNKIKERLCITDELDMLKIA